MIGFEPLPGLSKDQHAKLMTRMLKLMKGLRIK